MPGMTVLTRRVLEDVAQRQFAASSSPPAPTGRSRSTRSSVVAKVLGLEVQVAEVARPASATRAVSVPVRLPSSNGTRAMTAMLCCWQYGNSSSSGTLIEDVVDDLHGVDQTGRERPQHVVRLPAVDADADRATRSFVLQSVDAPAASAVSAAQSSLHTWNCCRSICRDADVLEALLGVFADVVGREHVVERVRRLRRPCRFFGGIFVAT